MHCGGTVWLARALSRMDPRPPLTDPSPTDPLDPATGTGIRRARARDVALWRARVFWWLGVTIVLGFLMWLIGPILMPFAVGAAVAYFLDPLVCRLERLGMPRALASAILVFSIMAVLIAAVVLLVPLLATEATRLIQSLPELYEEGQELIAQRMPGLDMSEADGAVQRVFAHIGESMAEADFTVYGGVVSGLNGLMRTAIFWVVMPVVAYYLLMDWQRLLRSAESLIPRANIHIVRGLARDIDGALAGYVRGVSLVCALLAAYYAALLGGFGLNYGLLVGVLAGAISFIPYIGAMVGGALAIGLALYQFWDTPVFIAVVVAIFLFGQFLESQILVPKLVGDSINLHPVWLIFAVMAFGYLFGLVGAIIAVPLAATMGVLVRFAVHEYRQSRIYAGATRIPSR